jgi:hypothetical protein
LPPLLPTKRQKPKQNFNRKEKKVMSTENYKGYNFRYVKDVKSPGGVKVYVENQPSYRGRITDSNTIHRYPAKNNAPPSICFKEKNKPRSLSEAKGLAHEWADRTDRYISTGVPISDQIKRR